MATTWRARPDEAPAVAGLLAAFRDHQGRSWPDDASFRETVRELIERPDTEFLLGATADGVPAAGVVQLRFRLSVWTASDDCWLEDLYVEEAVRRHGIGGALVEAAIARARARGCRRIELDVDEANAAARALYERLGFRDKGGGRSLFLERPIEENVPPEAPR